MAFRNTLLLFVICACFSTSAVLAQYSKDDWERRDEWMNVTALIDLLAVAEGDSVADVGCHEGYFSFHLSEKVGRAGRIYAVDVEEYRLDALKEHLRDRKVTNIEAILGEYDNPKLPENSLDAVIIMDTYHEMEAYNTILSHIKKSLKSTGRLLILEKLKKHKRDKDRIEQIEAHTISSKYVKKELEDAGFEIIESIADFGNWKNEPDKQMWILLAVPVQK